MMSVMVCGVRLSHWLGYMSALCLVLPTNAVTIQDKYVTNDEIYSFLSDTNTKYPDITHLYSIGKSVEDRDLWVLALASNKPNQHVPLRSEVKYVGNIHGNEVVGRDLSLRLIDYLTSQFSTNSTIRDLLTMTRVHILTSMNPDGFAASKQGDCYGVVGRYNARKFDLNRNFPEHFRPHPVNVSRQEETVAIMDWMKQIPFILSAGFHGGAMVANYPYDNYHCDECDAETYKRSRYATSPDDDLFRYLSLTYSSRNERMFKGNQCPAVGIFPDGITNGAEWYPLAGGMQDYNYIQHGCLELTLEVSCCKYPPADDPPSVYWNENKDSMIGLLRTVRHGVMGYVRYVNGTPAVDAHVDVVGLEGFVRSTKTGEFWKVLQPGHHKLRAAVRGVLMSDVVEVDITESMHSMLPLNFTLDRDYTVSQASPLTKPSFIYMIPRVVLVVMFVVFSS